MDDNILERFKPIREHLKEEIAKNLQKIPEPISSRLVSYILKSAGKMLRPLLILEVNRILSGTINTGIRYAIMTELLHNMSLIHDDIADWAPIRRGQKAYHAQWGVERAVLDGDVLLTFALTETDDISRQTVLETVHSIAVGNSIEVEHRLMNNFDFSPNEALEIMKLKTADVFRVALELACVAAGETTEFGKAFGGFATHAGLAFQVQDDFLDIYTSHKEWGKKSLWDIQESKRNLFLAFALKKEDQTRQRLIEIYSKPVGEKTEEELKEVVKIFYSVMPEVEEERDHQLKLALEELDKLRENLKDHPKIDELCDFFESFAALLTMREM